MAGYQPEQRPYKGTAAQRPMPRQHPESGFVNDTYEYQGHYGDQFGDGGLDQGGYNGGYDNGNYERAGPPPPGHGFQQEYYGPPQGRGGPPPMRGGRGGFAGPSRPGTADGVRRGPGGFIGLPSGRGGNGPPMNGRGSRPMADWATPSDPASKFLLELARLKASRYENQKVT